MASKPWNVRGANARALAWAVLIVAVGALAAAPVVRAAHWHLQLNGVSTDSVAFIYTGAGTVTLAVRDDDEGRPTGVPGIALADIFLG